MGMLTRRIIEPERMDDPRADPAELATALRFLAFINRRLGGVPAVLGAFRRWSGDWPAGATIRILDVGAGACDIPLALARWAARDGRRVHITALERHETILALARRRLGDRADIELRGGDALHLTDLFEVESFDYAHAGLLLHQLPDIEVMKVMRMMQRLTRRGLIINDLIRSPIARLGTSIGRPFMPAMVRHDAPVSVRAAFTKREILDLAYRVGLERISYRTHLFYRFTLT
ncbi:MAG: methyltransferase domain-containing protein, partial [Planctomycetota bacterium]|nr:methyltransferase domain-containing protein [Planctomycetota bacterium]